MLHGHWSSFWYNSGCNVWHCIWSHVINGYLLTVGIHLLIILIITACLTAAAAWFGVLKDGFEQVHRRTFGWFFHISCWQLLTDKYTTVTFWSDTIHGPITKLYVHTSHTHNLNQWPLFRSFLVRQLLLKDSRAEFYSLIGQLPSKPTSWA